MLLSKINEFIGYGDPSADIWFIGIEESSPNIATLLKRVKFRKFEDLAEAHTALGITKFHRNAKPQVQRTWRPMCALGLAMEDEPIPDKAAILDFQVNRLGRFGETTFLTEILPVPKPKAGIWPEEYREIFPEITNYKDYESRFLPQRQAQLRELLANNSPRLVVCYGKTFWHAFKALFPERVFHSRDQFDISTDSSPLVVLAPHLTYKSMNPDRETRIYPLVSEIRLLLGAD